MSSLRVLIPLTLATVAGIAATDLYLPAIPEMPELLGGTPVDAQSSLAVFIFTLAGGQLVFGSLGDLYDRRWILILSMLGFAATTIACAYAPSMDILIGLRAGQGFFASAAPALAPAILKALGDEKNMVKMISVIASVEALMPAFAPILGAWLIAMYGWQSTFWVTCVFGAIAVVGLARVTLPERDVQRGRSVSGYIMLLKNKPYMGFALGHALAFTAFIALILSLPYVIVTEWGRSINAFIAMQVVLVLLFIGAANTASWVMEKLGAVRAIVLGGWLQVAAAVAFVGVAVVPGLKEVWVLTLVMAPMVVGLGWRAGPGFSRALDQAPGQGGQAGGLMTCLALGLTGVATQAVAPFLIHGLSALAGMVIALSVLSMVILRLAVPLGFAPPPESPPEAPQDA